MSVNKFEQIVVKFSENIGPDAQGKSLMAFEQHLRELTGLDCRVFKELKGDDSKLRVMMTQKQRDKL